MRQYEEEIKALKLELAMHDTLVHRGTVSYDQLGEEEVEEVRKQVKMFIEGTIPDIEVRSLLDLKLYRDWFEGVGGIPPPKATFLHG